MDTSCFVCCENFDLKNRKKICCNNPSCEFSACKECTRNYLLNNVNDVHCMKCKQAWDQTFVIINLNRNWYNDTYIAHRKKLLFESEKSKFPETMPHVEKYNNILTIEKKQKVNRDKISELQEQIQILHAINQKHEREIRLIKTGKSDVERQKFIMPCQKESCRGFLSSAYKCGLCQDYCCSKCLEMLGPDKNIEHTCNEDKVQTATYIKNSTKPCPKCGERIHKIDGCDQMWCVECHTAFSWITGEIQNGVIHNPHYFQFMRNNNGGVMPRQPGDNPCENDLSPLINYMFTTIQRRLYDYTIFELKDTPNMIDGYSWIKVICTKKSPNDEWKENEHIDFHNNFEEILSALRIFYHIIHVEIPASQRIINQCNNTVVERVHYIVKETSEDVFSDKIIEKDIQRKKNVDILYVYDLIRNIGVETIYNNMLDIVDKNVHATREELKEIIYSKPIDELKSIVEKTANEIREFIKYCNRQFEIIGVSHNCSSKNINIKEERTYQRFNDFYNFKNNKTTQLNGYMIMNRYSLINKKKSTIKKVKEYYSKS